MGRAPSAPRARRAFCCLCSHRWAAHARFPLTNPPWPGRCDARASHRHNSQRATPRARRSASRAKATRGAGVGPRSAPLARPIRLQIPARWVASSRQPPQQQRQRPGSRKPLCDAAGSCVQQGPYMHIHAASGVSQHMCRERPPPGGAASALQQLPLRGRARLPETCISSVPPLALQFHKYPTEAPVWAC